MAKAIGADQNVIAALSQGFFAVAIEFGSGVGFWLVFGHAPPNRRREADPPSTELVPIDRHTAPQELQVVEETPHETVERFFLEVVRPALNRRVRSLAAWSAYAQWCADRGLEAVSHAMFGRLAPGAKRGLAGPFGTSTASAPKAIQIVRLHLNPRRFAA